MVAVLVPECCGKRSARCCCCCKDVGCRRRRVLDQDEPDWDDPGAVQRRRAATAAAVRLRRAASRGGEPSGVAGVSSGGGGVPLSPEEALRQAQRRRNTQAQDEADLYVEPWEEVRVLCPRIPGCGCHNGPFCAGKRHPKGGKGATTASASGAGSGRDAGAPKGSLAVVPESASAPASKRGPGGSSAHPEATSSASVGGAASVAQVVLRLRHALAEDRLRRGEVVVYSSDSSSDSEGDDDDNGDADADGGDSAGRGGSRRRGSFARLALGASDRGGSAGRRPRSLVVERKIQIHLNTVTWRDREVKMVISPYLYDSFNFLDALLIVVYTTIIVLHILALVREDGLNWGSPRDFVPTFFLADTVRWKAYMLAAAFMLGCFKAQEFMSINSSLSLFILIIKGMVRRLGSFFMVFLFGLVAFAGFEYSAFGLRTEDSATVSLSMMRHFSASLGDADFMRLFWTDQWIGPGITLMFAVLVAIILFNLLVAVMFEAYEEIKEAAESIWCFEQFKMLLEDEQDTDKRRAMRTLRHRSMARGRATIKSGLKFMRLGKGQRGRGGGGGGNGVHRDRGMARVGTETGAAEAKAEAK